MRLWFIILFVIGIFGIGAGFWKLRAYENTAGLMAVPPSRLHTKNTFGAIPQDATRPTLLLLTHPYCPCTQASLDELAKIMKRYQGAVAATVVFVQPEGMPGDPQKSALWQQATRIPGIHTYIDFEGKVARHLGAFTSGQTLLYSPEGDLLFSGGITAARGQIGDNAGQAAIESFLAGKTPKQKRFRVFGCSLFGEVSTPQSRTAKGL